MSEYPDSNVYNNWQEYYDILKDFYEFGGDYERHIEDGIYIELLKRGFDPQEGLNGFIKTSYVGRYAQDFIEEYEDIINTFINYGAKINIQIFDLVFNNFTDDFDDEYESCMIRANFIDVIVQLYNRDNTILEIDNELSQRISRSNNYILIYNILLQSDFSTSTKSKSLINIVIDYTANIIPLILYTYTDWSLINISGNHDAIMTLQNFDDLSINTKKIMLLKNYSAYLQNI